MAKIIQTIFRKMKSLTEYDEVYFINSAKDVFINNALTRTFYEIVEKFKYVQENATKVEKSYTNGNILINGVESKVYDHPETTIPASKRDAGPFTIDRYGHIATGSFDNWVNNCSGNLTESSVKYNTSGVNPTTLPEPASNSKLSDILKYLYVKIFNNRGNLYDRDTISTVDFNVTPSIFDLTTEYVGPTYTLATYTYATYDHLMEQYNTFNKLKEDILAFKSPFTYYAKYRVKIFDSWGGVAIIPPMKLPEQKGAFSTDFVRVNLNGTVPTDGIFSKDVRTYGTFIRIKNYRGLHCIRYKARIFIHTTDPISVKNDIKVYYKIFDDTLGTVDDDLPYYTHNTQTVTLNGTDYANIYLVSNIYLTDLFKLPINSNYYYFTFHIQNISSETKTYQIDPNKSYITFETY